MVINRNPDEKTSANLTKKTHTDTLNSKVEFFLLVEIGKISKHTQRLTLSSRTNKELAEVNILAWIRSMSVHTLGSCQFQEQHRTHRWREKRRDHTFSYWRNRWLIRRNCLIREASLLRIASFHCSLRMGDFRFAISEGWRRQRFV